MRIFVLISYFLVHTEKFFVFYELITPRKNDDFDLEFFPRYFRYLSSPPEEREKQDFCNFLSRCFYSLL